MSRVVLVQPPVREFYLTWKRTIPYGLASIAAGLEQAGFHTEIVDALACNKSKALEWPGEFAYLAPYYGRPDTSPFSLFHRFGHFGYSLEHVARLVREKQPLAVGISSLFTPYADLALETARIIKKFCPGTWTIMGGHHPTLFPDETLACSAVDLVLRGEGEASMVRLCRLLNRYGTDRGALFRDPDLDRIPGVAYRTGTAVRINAPAWVKSLDRLPLPASDKINRQFYRRKNRGAITVVASRGCPFPCSYCSVSAASSHARFRQRPVEDILEEIRIQAARDDIGFIDFEDENLTLNKSWVMRLLAGIQDIFEGKDVELRAMNGLYPPSLDEEIIGAMKAAGFNTLNLSLGSFSKDQLKRFSRPDVRRDLDRVLETAEVLGMDCVTYIIGGAPGQKPESSLADILLLARRRTLAGFSVFYPAPGSGDYDLCQKKGILPPSFSLMRSTALPLDHATSRLQAATLLRLTRILNFMKSLVDNCGSLPGPIPFPGNPALPDDRDLAGRNLLQWFLHDGIVRGVDLQGEIYAHRTDPDLAQQFVLEIKKTPVMGVARGPAGI